MREAMLYEKLTGGVVRCNVCQWRCVIQPGREGLCKVRHNKNGTLYISNYAQVSSAAVDPIEKKPLFHFYPGSSVFSLGGWGCNFHCKHCQNWQISYATPEEGKGMVISPEDAIRLTKEYNCGGIAWTYNEPGIWLEYTLDGAKLAKREGLYTLYVTNGFLTEEALDTIGPYLDGWCVDVKGFSDSFYQELAKVIRWRKVLDIAQRAQQKWQMHVEVITNVIPTMNDDEEQLEGIATWIRDSLGELTPWHVTRFYPHHQMQHLPPTPVATLERAYNIGKNVGLRFVYVGNLPGHIAESTVCPSCGRVVVHRIGYQVVIEGLDGSKCRFCGAELNIRTK